MTLTDPNREFALLVSQLDRWLDLGWQPSSEQQVWFQRLYIEILKGNQQLNLTRIIDPAEFWEKHLWDSLRGIQNWLNAQQQLSAIDIGTGAGFPGVPAAIACPQWQVTLLDSTHKKIAFLKTLLSELQLSAKSIVGRAEQIGQLPQHREQYDVALIRAVATASACAEYALPLLKLGGVAVLYRGQWLEAETTALQTAARQLGGTVDRIESFITPVSQSARHCIYLKKLRHTPAHFPRPVGIPTQKPL